MIKKFILSTIILLMSQLSFAQNDKSEEITDAQASEMYLEYICSMGRKISEVICSITDGYISSQECKNDLTYCHQTTIQLSDDNDIHKIIALMKPITDYKDFEIVWPWQKNEFGIACCYNISDMASMQISYMPELQILAVIVMPHVTKDK